MKMPYLKGFYFDEEKNRYFKIDDKQKEIIKELKENDKIKEIQKKIDLKNQNCFCLKMKNSIDNKNKKNYEKEIEKIFYKKINLEKFNNPFEKNNNSFEYLKKIIHINKNTFLFTDNQSIISRYEYDEKNQRFYLIQIHLFSFLKIRSNNKYTL
jgi:hypothetical protein